MAKVNVAVIFDVEDMAEAEAKVATWKLHEDCDVFLHMDEEADPHETDSTGKVKKKPKP